METIRNPGEWTAEAVSSAGRHLGAIGTALRGSEAEIAAAPPRARPITPADLFDALSKGFDDFRETRSDVIFLCVVYPLAGIAAVGLASNAALLPLLFPAVAGFALVGPVTAVGAYELSRRRERGESTGWTSAFRPIASPSFGAIFLLALGILATFLVWMGAAQTIKALTIGAEAPASLGDFAAQVFGTGAGWAMILVGCGVGFVFAAAVLATSLVSFPLLLDRQVGLVRAVMTSVEVARTSPRTVALWGLIVAAALIVASIPLFLGLIVALPVLGHATWHVYRKAVA
ncbi:DUF2189 domain-containing protein [Rubrimonas cliftonensis]|uniref:Uncharacterized membrane protein n=1 Tax=Rubrimonas cliftonensis TaxID=89524 RepID=A0A1H3Z8B4_9RHOB|nr:DUF2189 domain-containing protein [Rubrimonas cliftonensis]SEA19910.1 Uncharacterized membrane protein [Rubrimonas cliftonensis]